MADDSGWRLNNLDGGILCIMRAARCSRILAFVQGGFFFVSGIWPIVHLRSFLFVTGPKTDTWLVQTVGGLLAVFGIALLLVSRRPRIEAEWRFLGAAVPLVLAAVDIIFVVRDVIPPIYLADAAVEILFALAWIGCSLYLRRSRHSPVTM